MTKELLIELARNDDPYDNNKADYFGRTDQNPAIDLLLLEHPNLVEDIYFACFDEHPDFYGADDLEAWLSYWEEYSSFLYYLPDWFMNIAVKHKNEDLRIFAAGRVGGASEQSKQYIEHLIKDESSSVRSAMACSPGVSYSVLEKLVDDENPDVREALAQNEDTPASVLSKLAQDENLEVRRAVAENARCRDLYYYKSLNIRIDESESEKLIEVKNAFVSLMQKLAQDKDAYVRQAVARNKNTSASIS